MGGPDLDPESGLTSPRRSLYFRHAKEKRVTFLRLFDSSNVQSVLPPDREHRPPAGTRAGQQPAELRPGTAAGRAVASRRRHPRRIDAAFVAAVFERVLGRQPTAEEQAECEALPGEQAKRLADRPG